MKIVTWAAACLGAVLGAGFASGREICSFFTRWGNWSWYAIFLSGIWMGLVAWGWMNMGAARDRSCLGAGRWITGLLMGITAGSMTSAAGELISLCWPWANGYAWGVGITLTAAMIMSRRGLTALKSVSGLLLPGLVFLFYTANQVPSWEGAFVSPEVKGELWWGCLTYGSLNMTLAVPVLQETRLNAKDRRILAAVLSASLIVLLSMGNHILLKHPHLADAPLPMIALLRTGGRRGFYLGAAVLYLAVFTTLLTAVRGVVHALEPKKVTARGRMAAGAGTLGVALIGFQPLIEKIYPVLGWLCMGWMVCTVVNTDGRQMIRNLSVGKRRFHSVW